MGQTVKPIIFGLAGTQLKEEELAFFAEHQPAGFILFKRNCESPTQLRALTDALYAVTGRKRTLMLIDQEGGRVARLGPPHWRQAPAAGHYAGMAARGHTALAEKLVYLNARLIAAELADAGINVDCAPLADIPTPDCDAIIGDRAYGVEPKQVIQLARAMARGLEDGGVLPVLKHIPGHGRATADSHLTLPVVDASLEELEATDFVPFRKLHDLPLGMTAHIRYTALDEEHTATLSPAVIHYIREQIGFSGLLMTDDLSMKALKGDMGDLARGALEAGCDLILHCNGEMREMQTIAQAVSPDASGMGAHLTALIERVSQKKPVAKETLLAEYEAAEQMVAA